MSVAIYTELEAVYRQQIAVLEADSLDIESLKKLLVRAEQLLTQVDPPRDDTELAAAAAAAQSAQREVDIRMTRCRDQLRAAAIGVHRSGGAIKAYGSGPRQSVARYIDRKH